MAPAGLLPRVSHPHPCYAGNFLRVCAGTHQYWAWSTADARSQRDCAARHYALPVHGIAANFSGRQPAKTHPRKVAFHLAAPDFVDGACSGAPAPQRRYSNRARGELRREFAFCLSVCPSLDFSTTSWLPPVFSPRSSSVSRDAKLRGGPLQSARMPDQSERDPA